MSISKDIKPSILEFETDYVNLGLIPVHLNNSLDNIHGSMDVQFISMDQWGPDSSQNGPFPPNEIIVAPISLVA